ERVQCDAERQRRDEGLLEDVTARKHDAARQGNERAASRMRRSREEEEQDEHRPCVLEWRLDENLGWRQARARMQCGQEQDHCPRCQRSTWTFAGIDLA